jgi:hypothetical protein
MDDHKIVVPHLNDAVKSATAIPRPATPSPHAGRWLTTLLLVGCSAGFWLATPHASAQGRKSSSALIVSSQLRLTPGKESKLDISIAPEQPIPPRSVIVIRGVPASLRLSEGRPFGPGVWVVPATQVMSVKLQVPLEARVGGVVTVALTTLEGVSIAEAHVTLVTMPPAQELAGTAALPPAGRDDAPTAATQASEQQHAPAVKLTAEIRAELLTLLERGKESVRIGNILHARQFYQRAAEKGLAEAALALAATYDPGELSQMKVVGVTPDAELARKWYEKAKQLGSPEAAARLSALGRP